MASYINKFEGDTEGTITVSNANGLQYRLTTYADDSSEAVPLSRGGTGSQTAAGARTNLGLGTLATLNSVGSSQIDANSVGTSELNVGTSSAYGQPIVSAPANGGIAFTSSLNGSVITSNTITPTQLNVSGNGTSGQVLTSSGGNSMTWTTPSNTSWVPVAAAGGASSAQGTNATVSVSVQAGDRVVVSYAVGAQSSTNPSGLQNGGVGIATSNGTFIIRSSHPGGSEDTATINAAVTVFRQQ